ncbi:hypothetical protein JM49_29355 [Pseudomonas chlororaphis subsp. aurantiaca]|nr:hypothetical protein JM49_29355 [Pseudomonas chlororaphis subsp. aurantiaca]
MSPARWPAQQHRSQRLAPDQPPVQRWPRTAAPAGPAAQRQYQYDEQGRLQAHSVSQQQHGQHRNLYRRAYAYDANGNLAGIDDSRKGNLRYHYDPLDRLINVRGATPEKRSRGAC